MGLRGIFALAKSIGIEPLQRVLSRRKAMAEARTYQDPFLTCRASATRFARILAIGAFTLALPVQSAHASDRVALVVGNAEYRHAPRLLNPGNDAVDVSAALTRLGFDVTVLTDLDGLQLRSALRDFQRVSNSAEVAVVYYSGHGIGVDGQSWLAPVDARLAQQDDVEFETVSLDLVLASVRGARQLRLVILDACRDNPFISSMEPRPGRSRSLARGLTAVAPPRTDTLVWYAAKDGSTASDGAGRNSPFTSAFLEHVEEPGLELGRLFRKMTAAVEEKTSKRQTPWSYGTRGPEDFFLAGQLATREQVRDALGGATALATVCTPFREQALFEAAQKDNSRWPAFIAACPESPLAALAPNIPSAPTPPASAVLPWSPTTADFETAQTELTRLQLYRSTIDGIWGANSQSALERFQEQIGDTGTRGELSEALLTSLKSSPTPKTTTSALDGKPVFLTDDVASLAPLSIFRDCDACPEMVALPSGTYTMGSPESEPGRKVWEGPQQKVTIRSFAIGRTEVTFAMWDACAGDGYCVSNSRPSDNGWGRGSRPVINVSWNDITGDRGFLAWMNSRPGVKGAPYRLPSEAEWEYAARAGSTTTYPWGSSVDHSNANYGGARCCSGKVSGPDRWVHTAPVGSFPANRFGLFDVIGNVAEWNQDCWTEPLDASLRDGAARTSGLCSTRMLRGGSWQSANMLRPAQRSRVPTDYGYDFLGFRVSRNLVGE